MSLHSHFWPLHYYYIQSSAATTLVKVILSLVQLKVSSTDIVKIIFTETSSQHSTTLENYTILKMFILNLAISNIEESKDSNAIKDSNFSSLKLFKLTRSLDGLLEFNRRLNYFVSNQTMRCFKLLLFLSFNK